VRHIHALRSRLAQFAEFIEVAHRLGGVDAAVALAERRAGLQFDPALSAALRADAENILGGLDSANTWGAVIDAEPALRVNLSGDSFDRALLAIADFVDLKSPYTLGHARAVAELAAATASGLGLPEEETRMLRRAGLVHDLGRLGVSNAIWDKPGALTPTERERVRLHPYLTERMLASSGALAPLGAIAVQHHERLDVTEAVLLQPLGGHERLLIRTGGNGHCPRNPESSREHHDREPHHSSVWTTQRSGVSSLRRGRR